MIHETLGAALQAQVCSEAGAAGAPVLRRPADASALEPPRVTASRSLPFLRDFPLPEQIRRVVAHIDCPELHDVLLHHWNLFTLSGTPPIDVDELDRAVFYFLADMHHGCFLYEELLRLLGDRTRVDDLYIDYMSRLSVVRYRENGILVRVIPQTDRHGQPYDSRVEPLRAHPFQTPQSTLMPLSSSLIGAGCQQPVYDSGRWRSRPAVMKFATRAFMYLQDDGLTNRLFAPGLAFTNPAAHRDLVRLGRPTPQDLALYRQRHGMGRDVFPSQVDSLAALRAHAQTEDSIFSGHNEVVAIDPFDTDFGVLFGVCCIEPAIELLTQRSARYVEVGGPQIPQVLATLVRCPQSGAADLRPVSVQDARAIQARLSDLDGAWQQLASAEARLAFLNRLEGCSILTPFEYREFFLRYVEHCNHANAAEHSAFLRQVATDPSLGVIADQAFHALMRIAEPLDTALFDLSVAISVDPSTPLTTRKRALKVLNEWSTDATAFETLPPDKLRAWLEASLDLLNRGADDTIKCCVLETWANVIGSQRVRELLDINQLTHLIHAATRVSFDGMSTIHARARSMRLLTQAFLRHDIRTGDSHGIVEPFLEGWLTLARGSQVDDPATYDVMLDALSHALCTASAKTALSAQATASLRQTLIQLASDARSTETVRQRIFPALSHLLESRAFGAYSVATLTRLTAVACHVARSPTTPDDALYHVFVTLAELWRQQQASLAQQSGLLEMFVHATATALERPGLEPATRAAVLAAWSTVACNRQTRKVFKANQVEARRWVALGMVING